MTQKTKDWREGLPKWRLEAIEKEMKESALNAALSWPNEPRPEALPFWWSDYDGMKGNGHTDGTYWQPYGGGAWTLPSVNSVEISRKDHRWLFNGKSSVTRGGLYKSPKDAWMSALWDACDQSAAKLLHIKERVKQSSTQEGE
jgi:hypothetical protein